MTAGRLFTIAAARRLQLIDYGVLHIDPSHRLTGFSEKPQMEYLVSMGVYAVNRAVLDFVPPDSKYGFDNLMKNLLGKGESVTVDPYEGYWLDIGRPDDYMRAIEEFEQRKHEFLRRMQGRRSVPLCFFKTEKSGTLRLRNIRRRNCFCTGWTAAACCPHRRCVRR